MIFFLKKNSKKEILEHILAPFIYSRFLLLIIAWFSQYFQASKQYFPIDKQDSLFAFSSFHLLDVWGRWDSGWYLKIAQEGYSSSGSFAFFPLYPSLIKFFSLIVPERFLSQEVWLFITVALSNLFFIFGLIIFHFLVKNIFIDQKKSEEYAEDIAQKSVFFLLLFPTSFFFSCAYSESLFFILIVSSFYLIRNQKYLLASLIASLATLTKPYGILLLIPLVLSYLKNRSWQFSKIDWKILYFLLPILTLLGYCHFCYLQTGDFLAFLHAQEQWRKQLSWPWQSIFQPIHFIGFITPLEKILTIFGVFSLLLAFKFLPIEIAIWANLVNLVPLFSGTIISNMRYLIVLFPIFIVLAVISHKKTQLSTAIITILLVLQVLLFSAWCQFYWVA